jgi:hypothetical protein
VTLSSDYAWFKFDAEPPGGAGLAVDSNGLFDNITMNNDGSYDADKWLNPSKLSGGCGASVVPNAAEQEFLRLDTLTGALFVHYWLDVPGETVTTNTVFSYGSTTTGTDNFSLIISSTKRPYTVTADVLDNGFSMTTGQHAIAHIIDVANNTNVTTVDGLPSSSGNFGTIPTALPIINKFGFLLLQNNGGGTHEFGEANTGNLRISDLMIIRIETDKSSLFPVLIVDKFKAGRFVIPPSWDEL